MRNLKQNVCTDASLLDRIFARNSRGAKVEMLHFFRMSVKMCDVYCGQLYIQYKCIVCILDITVTVMYLQLCVYMHIHIRICIYCCDSYVYNCIYIY